MRTPSIHHGCDAIAVHHTSHGRGPTLLVAKGTSIINSLRVSHPPASVFSLTLGLF